MEFVYHADDSTAAHHRVSGMNFILGGYTKPVAVWKARAKAKSQLVASGEAENETEPPSPTDGNVWCNTKDDEDLPPSPPDEVHIGSLRQDAVRPLAQETQAVSDVEMPPARDPHTLELDIWKPPPNVELIQRVSEIFKAPQSTSKGVCLKKKKVPSSPPPPTQEDHPKDELMLIRKLKSKFKQDKRPRKKPKG